MNKAAKMMLVSTKKLIETPSAFQAWLSAREPDAVVGFANNGANCPLAIWLGSEIGIYLEVTTAYMLIRSREIPHCPWIVRFVSEIDSRYEDKVTAREALEVLDVVEAVLAAEQILSSTRYRPTEAVMCR